MAFGQHRADWRCGVLSYEQILRIIANDTGRIRDQIEKSRDLWHSHHGIRRCGNTASMDEMILALDNFLGLQEFLAGQLREASWFLMPETNVVVGVN